MSVLFETLEKLDATEANTLPWMGSQNSSQPSFISSLPEGILSDYYDLREYTRIANMRSQMHVLSIASPSPGEGSSTIAAHLAYLLCTQLIKAQPAVVDPITENGNGNGHDSETENEEEKKIFEDEFKAFFQAPHEPQPEIADEDEFADKPAENGKKNVLLVDANLAQPSLHRYFSFKPGPGLAEVLEAGASWKTVLNSVKNTDLKVILAGSLKGNAADLIGSDEFRNLIREWRESFRFVIFNSPAVLSYVESLTLAALVNGVVLVLRAGHTRWEIAQTAKRRLQVAHAHVLGVTLNRF